MQRLIAQATTTSVTVPIAPYITGVPTNLGVYVSNIIGAALIGAAVFTFIYLVWGGIQWIVAGGDKGKLEEAKNRITGALIGLAVTAASWAIFMLVDNFLGIDIAGNTAGTTSSATSTTGGTNHLGNYTANTSACRCQYNGCANLNAVSQLSSSTDCRICTSGGWTSTGAPATCTQVITCGRCP